MTFLHVDRVLEPSEPAPNKPAARVQRNVAVKVQKPAPEKAHKHAADKAVEPGVPSRPSTAPSTSPNVEKKAQGKKVSMFVIKDAHVTVTGYDVV